MAPTPALPSITSNATLHALTERLASNSRGLSPLLSSRFADSLANYPLSAAAAANQFRQPAPPPQLPGLQLIGRHQDPPPDVVANGKTVNGNSRCPERRTWGSRGADGHSDVRCARCGEEEMEGFVWDMGVVLRREFDCWVEQCWTEAFHQLFTRAIPTLMIHLILSGSSPQFLRRKIVHGGPDLDNLFQMQMLDLLYTELSLRLSGIRQIEPSSSSTAKLPGDFPLPTSTASASPLLARDGVCFLSLGYDHSMPLDEEDHGLCLCQLTSCLGCFRISAENRKGPSAPLPLELQGTSASMAWIGSIETPEQARTRREGLRPQEYVKATIPPGQGFVKNPRRANPNGPKLPPLFPHPQMTDVLAVEEHLRWRLKELGANDPAVESRYGPCTNHPSALEGIEIPEDFSEDGDWPVNNAGVGANGGKKTIIPPTKPKKGRGKARRTGPQNSIVPATKKAVGGDKDKGKTTCYLPKEWVDEDPAARNTAIVLTFRHFVKLLHQIATAVSPFAYPSYSADIDELEHVHPIALYRRLAEPSITRRKSSKELRAWVDCMDKWAEELGAREKTQGNKHVSENRHAEAVEYYTRAISLDPKKTVYYSNRAVALNSIGEHERAELDCQHILSKDSKNGKAFYQRAVARRGMERWREAEADLREVLKFQPGNESAKRLMAIVKAEVAKLPKQSARDAMDF